MANNESKGGSKRGPQRDASSQKTWSRSAPKRPAHSRPNKLDLNLLLKSRTPLPPNADALRGVHALPGFKSQIPFAAWCVRLGKLKVLEQVIAKHPQLLRELGLNGRSVLHTAASKGLVFVTPLLEAGLDSLAADHDGLLPVDMAIKSGNKAVVRVLAPAGDLDSQVLLDYPEFVRRVCEGEAPRLPTRALAAVVRKVRLKVDARDTSGASRAAEASKIVTLVAALRKLGARPEPALALEVHALRSEELTRAFMTHGEMSSAERSAISEALAASSD